MLLSGNGTPSIKVKTGYLVKSLLNVPLKVNGQAIGVLGVDNRVSNAHFSLGHLRRLSALADMAAVAIDNARRYTELNRKLTRRGQEISTLQAMAGQLSDITDFRVGARLVLSLVLKATNAEAGVLAWTIGDDGLPVHYVSQGSLGGLLVAQHNERVPGRWWDERTLHAAIRTGEPVLEAGLDSERNGHNARARSRLATPLRRNGKVIGAIHLESSMPYAFSQEDIQFVSSVSDQVALALEGKALYERAETERERWSILMEAVDDAVWVVDADLRLLAHNAAASKMFGWSPAEAVGCSICELISSSHSAESLCQLLSQVMETRQSVTFPSQDSPGGRSLLLRTTDSQAVPIAGRAVPLVRDGRVVGAICAFRAVLGETGNGLVRLEFSNMASHLLRSPLSFIQAGVDLLLNGDLNGEEQGVVLHKMREQSQRMRDFIKDLLELARLESGSVDIYPEPVVLPPIIKRVLSLVQTEEADYEFSFRSPGEFPIVAADPGKLELILLALLHSAMNRCPSGGHIDIELEMHETEALISIQDNGEVIPAKQLERIFSQYYPVDDDNDKMPSTYQIGLYATKRLIELQNGRVWVESQPGKGTRLGFSLPFWE
jgi:PAS domain S-box-containing protein